MSWYRAAFLALLFFSVIFLLFTFTFKGTQEMYTSDLIFWGAILRPQEVSAESRHLSTEPADAADSDVSVGRKKSLLPWVRGIAMDKPDLFRNVPPTVDEAEFRFVGERVDLDEQKEHPVHLDNDIPQPAPVKMRLEHL